MVGLATWAAFHVNDLTGEMLYCCVPKLDIIQNVSEKLKVDESCADIIPGRLILEDQLPGVDPVHVILEDLWLSNLRKTHGLLFAFTPTTGACGSKELRLGANDVFVDGIAELIGSDEDLDEVAVVVADRD
jgi:hypothetical protein